MLKYIILQYKNALYFNTLIITLPSKKEVVYKVIDEQN